jgi:hypothetical protein
VTAGLLDLYEERGHHASRLALRRVSRDLVTEAVSAIVRVSQSIVRYFYT